MTNTLEYCSCPVSVYSVSQSQPVVFLPCYVAQTQENIFSVTIVLLYYSPHSDTEDTFNIQYFLFIWQSEIIVLKLFILDLKLRVLNTTHHRFQHILLFNQAQFQFASSVQVQLRTEISLIITVRPTQPTRPGKYISSLNLNMYSRWMAIGCLGRLEVTWSDWG